MTQYSCVIIDSNKFFNGILTDFIAQSPELQLIATIRSGDDRTWASRDDIDVVFYDPDVLGPSSRRLLDQLPGNPQHVIISSNEEYAIQALMSDVTDFLEKSILTRERFAQTTSLIKSNAKDRMVTVDH